MELEAVAGLVQRLKKLAPSKEVKGARRPLEALLTYLLLTCFGAPARRVFPDHLITLPPRK